MNYNFNGKNIRIPDEEIKRNMTCLDMTQEEAIQTWLEDEGYLENAVVEELSAKAKENKVSHEAKAVKPRKAIKRERKPDEEKENLIKILAKCLENEGITAQITNKSKVIEFNVGENHYKLDLIKQRAKKN
jgi:hypothetical protein